MLAAVVSLGLPWTVVLRSPFGSLVREPREGVAKGFHHRPSKFGVPHGQPPRRLESKSGEHCEGRFPGRLFILGWLPEAQTELLPAVLFENEAGQGPGESGPQSKKRRTRWNAVAWGEVLERDQLAGLDRKSV